MTDNKENESQKIVRNSLLSFSNQIAVNGATVLMNICLIRAYGNEFHNKLIYLFSVVSIISLVADLGMTGNYGVREIIQRKKSNRELSSYISSLQVILLSLALFFSLLMLGTSSWLSQKLGIPALYIYIMALWAFAVSVQRIHRMIAIGFESFQYPLIFTLSFQGLLFVWSALCLANDLSLTYLFYGWAIIALISFISGSYIILKLLSSKGIRSFSSFMAFRQQMLIIKGSFPFFVPAICSAGLPPLVFLILSLWSTDNLSLLQVSFSLALVGRIVSESLATALFPVITRLAGTNESTDIFNLTCRYLAAILLCILTATWLLGDFVLVNVYGEHYSTGFYALIIFTVATAVESYRKQVDIVLISNHYEKTVAFWEIFKLVFITAFIYILFPYAPLLAAPLAVLTSSVLTTLGRVMTGKTKELQFSGSTAMKTGLGILVILATGYYLPNYLVLFITPLIIYLLKFYTLQDIKALRRFIRRTS